MSSLFATYHVSRITHHASGWEVLDHETHETTRKARKAFVVFVAFLTFAIQIPSSSFVCRPPSPPQRSAVRPGQVRPVVASLAAPFGPSLVETRRDGLPTRLYCYA